MKIIIKDNFDTGTKSDELICSNVKSKYWAEKIVNIMNEKYGRTDNYFCLVEDDYVLYNCSDLY